MALASPPPVSHREYPRRHSWLRCGITLGLLVLLFGPPAGRIWQRLTVDTQVNFNPPGKRPPERITISRSNVVRLSVPRTAAAQASISPLGVAVDACFEASTSPLVLPASSDLVAPEPLRGPPAAAIL